MTYNVRFLNGNATSAKTNSNEPQETGSDLLEYINDLVVHFSNFAVQDADSDTCSLYSNPFEAPLQEPINVQRRDEK